MSSRVLVIGRDSLPSGISLGRGEELDLVMVIPASDEARNIDFSLEVNLDAPDARLEISALYLCSKDDDIKLKVNVRHNSGQCYSRQLFKGIVRDNARAEFDGLIYVAQDAQQTKSYQENHNILLSSDAFVESKPQLEIYADDVECSHGATTGFLNEDEQFYMRQRGIPEAEAKRLQMISFLAPVAEKLPEELKNEIYDSLA